MIYYIDNVNDPPDKICAEAEDYFKEWFEPSDAAQEDSIKSQIDAARPKGEPLWSMWWLGALASGLVQVHDLVAPLDALEAKDNAKRYLQRLGRIACALLNNRDDKRADGVVDPFRNCVMPAWGGWTADRDGQWNTDPVTAGLFIYAMAAFARRVADHPVRYAEYQGDAICLITATMETYEAFRPEMYLEESDPEAYYTSPLRYADLQCNGGGSCEGYKAGAGKPISYNENLSMMKALAEVAIAADSALYRNSPDATPERLRVATEEVPLLIAKNVAIFVNRLRPKTLSDGTPYFEWDHDQSGEEIEDLSHGGFDLDCVAVILDDQIRLNALLARAGRNERVPLSPSLFARFANTFLRKIWRNDNTLSGNVKGEHDSADDGCGGWITLAQFDPWVWTRSRDTTFPPNAPSKLVPGSHADLLRYRRFNSMKYLTDFAAQNWLITPAALAVGESPPANIRHQKWFLVLSGVVITDLKGDSTTQWDYQTVSFSPDMAGPDDPSSTSGPLNWAISHYSIPKPPGSPGAQYLIRFSVEEWAPCVSLSAIFNQGQSINSGFAVDAWRPNHFGSGTDVLTNQSVNNLFAGINADLAVRDTDAWLYRVGYNITLLGKIVFVAPAF
jgi:hypothetical protein